MVTDCEGLRIIWPDILTEPCCPVCHGAQQLFPVQLTGSTIYLCCATTHAILRCHEAGGLHLEFENDETVPTLRVLAA